MSAPHNHSSLSFETAKAIAVARLHHDIGTTTSEEVVLLRLAAAPDFREAKK
jgi:hypothetical protein